MDSKKKWLLILAIAVVAVVIFVLVVGVGGLLYYRHYTGSPQYSLGRIQKAIDERDLPLFEKHVDVDRVAASVVDGMMVVMRERQRRPASSWEQLGQAFGEGLMSMMGPRLKEEVADDIRDSVLRGQRPGEQKITLKDLERVVKSGDSAEAHFRVEIDGQPATAILNMERRGRYWQVTAIQNAEELARETMPPS